MVSVVIAGVSADRIVDRCVSSLRRISGAHDLEIIVLRGDPRSLFQLRAQGIAQASGQRIAVLGDRYEVTPQWLNAVLERSEFDITGGCVAPARSLGYWGWCVYLSEYSHIAPPVTAGVTQEPKQVPGGNVVYAASILRPFPPLVQTDLSLHASLRQAGASMGIRPRLEAVFAHPPAFSEYVRERFWFSRTLGREGGLRKLLFAPLLPLVLLFRVGTAVMRKRRYGLQFLRCAPVILLLSAVQSAGEFGGALWRHAE